MNDIFRKSKWLDRLAGPSSAYDLEARSFNVVLFLSIATGPVFVVLNILTGLSIVAIVTPALFSGSCAVIYWHSIRKRRSFRLLYCSILLLFTAVMWVFNGGGSSGGLQYFFLYTFVLPMVLLRGRSLVAMMFVNCLVLLLLLTYEHFDGSLIVQYPDRSTRFVDIVISSFATFGLVAIVIRIIYSQVHLERKRSEDLLANLLPQKIIHDLKETGSTRPELFAEATVLFCDIVGFTSIAEKLPADELIDELNGLFTVFDTIVSRHDCERIKTVGDGYIAVCGLPELDRDHCAKLVGAAIDMMHAVSVRNATGATELRIKIGIHSGDVIGSVVGIKKYIYDIFGDTVNTTSRLEALSQPMAINASQQVVDRLNDRFSYTHRGKLAVKGKGEMDMYFIHWEDAL